MCVCVCVCVRDEHGSDARRDSAEKHRVRSGGEEEARGDPGLVAATRGMPEGNTAGTLGRQHANEQIHVGDFAIVVSFFNFVRRD